MDIRGCPTGGYVTVRTTRAALLAAAVVALVGTLGATAVAAQAGPVGSGSAGAPAAGTGTGGGCVGKCRAAPPARRGGALRRVSRAARGPGRGAEPEEGRGP